MTLPDHQTAATCGKFLEPYVLVPAPEIYRRISTLQDRLIETGLGGCLLLQNTDIFYFSGTMQNGALFIPAQGEPVFWIRRSLDRGRAESPLNDIRPQNTLGEICREITTRLPVGKSLGLELDVLPTKIFQRYGNELDQIQLGDISPLIRGLRTCKSDYELECINKACLIASEVFTVAKTLIRPGITELELQAELEYQTKIRGHPGIARMRGWNNELFFGTGNDQVSFVGHGVGLEVDEFPFLARGSKQILEPGMVFALEPKFIFPGHGVATIENTYLLTKDGCRRLTTDDENIFVL